jgi:hypothetical protein
MKKAAVDQCTELLKKASSSCDEIANAKFLPEVQSAWSDFLVISQRIHTKLEQGAKGNNESYAWWGLKRHERRTDPLLRYSHHARNADEHGLAEITERASPYVALGVGPGEWQIDITTDSNGVPSGSVSALGGQVPGKSKFVETKPARVVLVTVFDKGDSYDPPIGGDATPLAPLEAAKGVLNHLTAMLGEARQLSE